MNTVLVWRRRKDMRQRWENLSLESKEAASVECAYDGGGAATLLESMISTLCSWTIMVTSHGLHQRYGENTPRGARTSP